MSKLMPLIESSDNARTRALLHAARMDGARRGSQQRALLALGVGTATTAAGSAAAASSAAVATSAVSLKVAAGLSLPLIAAKWLVIGSLAGVALASGTAAIFSKQQPNAATPRAPLGGATPLHAQTPEPERAPSRAPSQKPALDHQAAPDASPAPLEPSHRVRAASPSSAANAPSPAQAVPSQAAFEAPEHSKVLRDVALLDHARSALRSGDAARALAELNSYDAQRETHILDREAQLLRIESLEKSGDSQQAKQLARAYLSAFPGDAHEPRLRALLGE